MEKLRFYAVEGAMVQDHAALTAGVRRYIGLKFVPAADADAVGGWKPTDEPTEIDGASPYRSLYVRDCRDGMLRPADEATALACGLKFEAAKAAVSKAEKAGS